MDIKDILSPTEKETSKSVSSTPSTPQQSPFKYVQRTRSGPQQSSASRNGPGPSSLSQSMISQSKISAHMLVSANQAGSSPLISPIPTSSNHPQYTRASSSAQSIDTLADLASMQNHQPVKSAPMLRGRNSYDSQTSPSFHSPIPASLTSNPRASFDINMLDTPKQTIRTDFTGSSLPADQQARLSQLISYTQETPSAYESHIEIIGILHDGLVDHIYPSSDVHARRDPGQYDLLQDLRDARERMEKLFAVGEDLWSDWLQDESLLARSAEDRISVVEKCRRAVEEEVGSIKLWSAYGDWVYHCYNWAFEDCRNPDAELDEEKLVGREIFTRKFVLDTWQEAMAQTRGNIAQSHVIWNKFLELTVPDLNSRLDPDQVAIAQSLFGERLKTPHLAWNDTFQAFSSFVSTNLETQYESIMMETNRSASKAKEMVASREHFETSLQSARDSSDRNSEYETFLRYIEWEQTTEKRRKPDPELINALYERAELRFPSEASLWEEHVMFLENDRQVSTLELLERATKHCPWSGSLWSHYLLTSDRMGQTFQDTEGIKHKATNTGILEAAGIEEIITVHATWCSYLRRRSSQPDGSEEDIDVAEMGIRSSIETVSSQAVKLGLGEAPGSSFRLRRIYISFLTDSGRWDHARHEFDISVRDFGRSYEFWLQFYRWEMMRWRRFATSQEKASEDVVGALPPPDLATAVMKKAIDQPNLDYPEPIMSTFVTHCEDHADAEELQQALFKVHKMQKALSARRQFESIQAAEAAAVSHAAQAQAAETLAQGGKRKREDETEDETSAHKRVKDEEDAHPSVEQNEPSKRDRENATILVQNLPDDITDVRVRQYFSNCGMVRSLKVIREDDVSAIVEFEDDEAAQYALSRDGQEFEGALLSVILDTGSTVYLTNYKPSADEKYIRDLFDAFGDIVSVRFPSLQGNKRRRFCYVQFKLPVQARAALQRDGEQVEGLTLVCKISDPAVRKARDDRNTVNDGRTVFVGHLHFKTTEDEVKEAFSQYGNVELIRMPRSETKKDRNKGIAFITYPNKDSAAEALVMNGKEIRNRKIVVNIATNDTRRSMSKDVTTPVARSNKISESAPQEDRRDRQVFLTEVPDTVNESRVRTIAETCGKVIRVILKTNHQGAILEYATAAEAGEAALKLDGHEIDPGRRVRVVTEAGMHAMTREKKVEQFSNSHKNSSGKAKAAPPIGSTGPVRRPGQPARKGGNLGQRSAALMHSQAGQKITAEVNGTVKKSNDDFRAMMNKS